MSQPDKETTKLFHFPWGKFWWSAWLNDSNLQSCDVNARGLWMDMICLMYLSEKVGFLVIQGRPMTAADIAKRTGVRLDRTRRLLKILQDNGVFSVDENGAIYCRRIVREERLRQKQYVDKNVDKAVDNNHGKLHLDDNRTETERKAHDYGEQNQGKSTLVAKTPLIKNQEKEFKKEKLNKKKKIVDQNFNHTFPEFLKTACDRLQKVAKVDAIQALKQVEVWFEATDHDGERVLKAIELGWGKAYPIGYISKVIENKQQRSTPTASWCVGGEKHAQDEDFQRLHINDQGIVLDFEAKKDQPSWYIKRIENYNLSAFKYLCEKGLISQAEFA